MSQLEERVKNQLQGDDKQHLLRQLEGRNLEQALSRIRRVAALLDGDTELEGLTREAATNLDKVICQAIVSELSVDEANLEPVRRLASWASRADYHWPLEVFTVNYDLLIETAFERVRLPYFGRVRRKPSGKIPHGLGRRHPGRT